jgi:hypothetical protein
VLLQCVVSQFGKRRLLTFTVAKLFSGSLQSSGIGVCQHDPFDSVVAAAIGHNPSDIPVACFALDLSLRGCSVANTASASATSRSSENRMVMSIKRRPTSDDLPTLIPGFAASLRGAADGRDRGPRISIQREEGSAC